MKWFSVCLLALGCAHSPPISKVQPSPVANYYPLAVGNTWKYAVKMFGAPQQPQQISIVKEEAGRFTDSLGNILSIDAFGIRDERRYLMRTPLQVGTRWSNVVSVSSNEQYEIIEVGHPCNAPAGSYKDCVVVESRNKADADKTLVATLTFAPNVGLIRVATFLEDRGNRVPQTVLELTEFVSAGAKAATP